MHQVPRLLMLFLTAVINPLSTFAIQLSAQEGCISPSQKDNEEM